MRRHVARCTPPPSSPVIQACARAAAARATATKSRGRRCERWWLQGLLAQRYTACCTRPASACATPPRRHRRHLLPLPSTPPATPCSVRCSVAVRVLQLARHCSQLNCTITPHNFSRAAVRDVDVWPRSLRLRRRHVAARAAGALLPRRAPAAAAAPCMSLCTLPCPAPSRSIKIFTARLHRTVAHHGGKGGESRCAAPATFENMDDEKCKRKRKRRRKKRRMRPSRQQTLQASAASSTRTHSACFFWREISRAEVPFQLLRGSEPAPSSSCRQSAWPFWAEM